MAGESEKIGLEAVLDTAAFQKGMQTYLSGIANMYGKTHSIAGQLSGQFVGLGQGVLRFGAIAGGAALVGVGALATGIVALGGIALGEYAKFERLTLSVQSLVAREISQGKEVEQVRTSVTKITKEEAAEIENLKNKIHEEGLERATALSKIQEQKQRVWELTQQYGNEGLAVDSAKNKLAEMEYEIVKADRATADMTGKIAELEGKSGQLVETMEKVRTGQISYADALKIAGPRAEELLGWITKLAVQSPFNQEGIAAAFRTALAYGFTSEAAQRLTQAEVDFAAATGSSIESANLIALALGQMQAKGKVSGQEIIQLTNAGIGVNGILEEMGFTLDDVSNGLVDADSFIEKIISSMEVFEGEAARQSTTFSGLIASMEDLKGIALREFFTSTFKAIQPYLADFVNLLSNPEGMKTIARVGDILGSKVATALKTIGDTVAILQGKGLAGLFASWGLEGSALFLKKISILMGLLTVDAEGAGTAMDTALSWLSTSLFPTLSAGIQFVIDHFEEFKAAAIGVGAVLGAGVFAAVLAGLFALLTPINLIIVGAALLAAAWVGNWYNIQGITAQVVGAVVGVLNSLWATFQANLPTIMALMQTAGVIFAAIWAGVIAGIVPLQMSLNQLGAVFSSFGISWADVGNALLTATGYVFAGIATAIVLAISVIIGLVSGIAAFAAVMINTWAEMMAATEVLVTGVLLLFSGDLMGGLSMILEGLGSMILTLLGGVVTAVLALFLGFGTSVIAFWQGLYDSLVGHSIVTDMTEGILGAFTGLTEGVLGAVGGLISGVIGLFSEGAASVATFMSSLMGGGGDAAAGVGFDPTTMLSGITAVQAALTVLTSTSVPALLAATMAYILTSTTGLTAINTLLILIGTVTLIALTVAITATAVMWTALLQQMLSSTKMLDTLLIAMYTQTVPTLMQVTMTAGAAMVTAITAVHSPTRVLTALISTMQAKIAEIGPTTKESMEEAAEGFEEAEDSIDTLVKQVLKAVEAFKKMAEAAAKAASASKDAGKSSEAQSGIGFARGVGFAQGTLGWTVPQGFPNDSFPIRVQSGEELLVAPRGRSIESIMMDRLGSLVAPAAALAATDMPAPEVNVGPVYVTNGMGVEELRLIIRQEVRASFRR